MRAVPQDIQAEESILGAIMLRPIILNDVVGTLDIEDFYRPGHKYIFAAMLSLHSQGHPIDAVTVADELRKGSLIDEMGGIAALVKLTDIVPSISNYARYVDPVIETSRRRRMIHQLMEISESAFDRGNDIDELVKRAEDISADDLIAPRAAEIQGLFSLERFVELADEAIMNDDQPWLIPHVMKPRWRTILVAAEGVGKAVLMRFLGIHVAAGRDPWDPRQFIEPRRVTYVDAENPAETIMHQLQVSNRNPSQNPIKEAIQSDMFHIWHREGGMNLRDRKPQAEFEAVLQKTRPEILFIGPMYKCFKRHRGEDLEQATGEFTEFIDQMRVRYNCAVMLEHHAPKASGNSGFREMNPFGSSLLMRWPELGITLDMANNEGMTENRYELTVGRFRRDRVANDWPQRIERNDMSNYAWSGIFEDGRGARVGLEVVKPSRHFRGPSS